MARKLRLQYPGAIYHVMNRGNRREAIFADDDEREFPKTQTQNPAKMVKFSQPGANVANLTSSNRERK